MRFPTHTVTTPRVRQTRATIGAFKREIGCDTTNLLEPSMGL